MKNKIYLIAILLNTINIFGQAQYLSNAVNSPTSVANPTVFIGANPVPSGTFKVYIKDDIRWETYNINNFSSQVLSSTSLVYKPISYTPSSSEINTALGYAPLSVETDPIWISDKTNYYTKSASDSRYLQNFTETDPIWASVSGTYKTKVENDGLYVSLTGAYTDPIWVLSLPYTKITGVPTIPNAQVKADWTAVSGITQILNKPIIPTDTNQLVNGSGYITASSTNTLTNKTGNISQWTNNTGYITGITSANVTTALGYTAYNATNPAGYISSFTELDPTVPAYSKTLTGFSVIKVSTDPLYKAIGYVPTSLEVTTALGFTPYNSTNPNGYISSVPAQSFASLTSKPTTIAGYGITDYNSLGDARWSLLGHTHTFASLTSKPTTLSGYSITDAYPLTGNPSAYLTAINSGQVTGALGYTPLSTEVDGSITNEIQTLSISGNTISLSSGGSVNLPNSIEYINTGIITGGAGNIIFYLTSDKTSTGTALYTNLTYVNPIVNDSTINYSYGWSYNSGTKALTVNTKSAIGLNVALVGLTLLGIPGNAPNGTSVQILVKGN